MFCVVLLAVLLILTYVYLKKRLSFWENQGVKHIKPNLVFGSLFDNITKKLSIAEIIQEHYNRFRNERYYGMYAFLQPLLVVRDPELIKNITVKNFDHFVDHQNHAKDNVDPLWSKTIFARTGDDWHGMRTVLSPAFTGSKMRFMFPLINECAEDFVDFFCMKNENVLELEMKDTLTRATNDMIASTAFGIKCDSLREPNNEFYVMGRKAFTFSGIRRLIFFMYNSCPKLMKLLGLKIFNDDISEFFRRVIKETIVLREEEGLVRPDMIHLMLECKKGNLNFDDEAEANEESFASTTIYKLESPNRTRINISDEDITAQALIFFFAGFDTSAYLMGFIAYELALNPDIQQKLRDEVKDAFERGNGKLSFNALMSMTYMDMVVTETLRKYPVSLVIDRMCTKDYTIEPKCKDEKPVYVKKGTVLWVPVYGMHRDAQFYPDPEKFDPERFSKENKSKIDPFSYIPFGSGPRNCIGSRFALMENKAIIAHILRRLEIVRVERTKVPLDICKSNFIITCADGLWLGFKKI